MTRSISFAFLTMILLAPLALAAPGDPAETCSFAIDTGGSAVLSAAKDANNTGAALALSAENSFKDAGIPAQVGGTWGNIGPVVGAGEVAAENSFKDAGRSCTR